MIFLLVSISACLTYYTASKSHVNKNITADCVINYINHVLDSKVFEIGDSSAVVEFQSAIITLNYSQGKLKALAKSTSQTVQEYKKKGALKPLVTELADKINDDCSSG